MRIDMNFTVNNDNLRNDNDDMRNSQAKRKSINPASAQDTYTHQS